jgi:cell division protein WhiA
VLLAGEVRGELARIQPARACCRRAELAGLLHGRGRSTFRTLDHATARTAVQLASSLGIAVAPPRAPSAASGVGRHHLVVAVDAAAVGRWDWRDAPACDRRSFLRGALLGSGSISFTASGPHVEFVVADPRAATSLRALLAALDVRALRSRRRGRHVVYLKGQEEIAALFRLVGANRGLLELETQRVGRDVQARLNRLLNAEEANLDRTVRAADRQLLAIARLESQGTLARLPVVLRETAAGRRRMPDADLDTLATAMGVSRSAVNHRLRRLVELGSSEEKADADAGRGRQLEDEPADAGGGARARARRP